MEKHFATSGFIVNKENTKVLMVFHKKLNTWVIPGGHLELNELPSDGACREVFEETGIRANILDSGKAITVSNDGGESTIPAPFIMLREYIPAHGEKDAHIHMDFVFLGVADENEQIIKQEKEVSNVKWIALSDIKDCQTFDSIKQIAQEIMNRGGIQKCVSSDLS